MKKDSLQLWTQFMWSLKKPEKIQGFNGIWTRGLAIPVWCTNQLNYEATDVGSWSFMCLLLMIYEINHIFFYVFIFRWNWGPKGQIVFFETGPPLSQRLDDQHPLPSLPSNPLLWRSGSASESLLAG